MNGSKRIFAVLAAAAAAFVLAFALVGCANTSKNDSKFVGTWDIVGLKAEDGSNDLDELLDAVRESGAEMSVTLSDDGVAKMKLVSDQAGDSSDGTWELKDDKTIVVTIDGVPSEASFDDEGHLVFYDGGGTTAMICEKRSKS